MDQGTPGVKDHEIRDPDPDREARRLEEKVEAIRDNLGGLVGELDRRRHRLTAAGKRALPYAAGVVGAAGLAVTGALIWRRRRRPSRARRMLTALQRLSAHPDRVGQKAPSVINKIIAAAGAAAASMAVRRLADKLIAGKRQAPPAATPQQPRRGVVSMFAPALAMRNGSGAAKP